MGAQAVCDKLLAEDPDRERRQIGYVDAAGGSAAFTGDECPPWCGHLTGPDFAAQGNLLMGAGCVAAMSASFQRTGALDLAERLIAALEAGQAAGGDARGKQSASVLVVHTELYPLVDLRADEHRNPIGELRRIHAVAKEVSLPFMAQMPTRDNPLGSFGDTTRRGLGIAPTDRPGGGGSGVG